MAKVVKAQVVKLGKTPADQASTCPVCHSRDIEVRKPDRGLTGFLGRFLCNACGYREEATI